MDGQVRYNSLQEAVDALNKYAQQLDDPIDQFLNQSNQIGEDGAAAWGGTAAESVVPVLQKIKADIVQLQGASAEFSENVNRSLTNYENADAQNTAAVNNVVG
ncbi:MAG: WXG100 family type VII secretion target [Bacilli bacterium]|nr:WXG100 family type VII secretion target [Bacilli bacterium]